jgi:hypothetical protein
MSLAALHDDRTAAARAWLTLDDVRAIGRTRDEDCVHERTLMHVVRGPPEAAGRSSLILVTRTLSSLSHVLGERVLRVAEGFLHAPGSPSLANPPPRSAFQSHPHPG